MKQSTLPELQRLYVNNEFEEAKKFLLSKKESLDELTFHYNLGTIFLKQGQYSAARYHLEKAKILGSMNIEVLHNLELAQQKIPIQLEVGDGFWERAQFVLKDSSMDYYLLGGALLAFVWIIVSIGPRSKKISSGFLKMSLAFILMFIPIVVKKSLFQNKFVIVLSETPLREGPSEIFESPLNIPQGVKVEVSKVQNGWAFIQFPKKLRGWAKAKDIAFLGPSL